MTAVTICALAAVATVFAFMTGVFSSQTSTRDWLAQTRCESDVQKRLASPSTASLSDVKSTASDLLPDNRDMFALMGPSLQSIDHSRITVWNVSGVVDASTEVGSTIHDAFTCRAYFVDGVVVDTLVVFDREH